MKRELNIQTAKQNHDIMMIDLDTIKGTLKREYFRQKHIDVMNRNIKKSLFVGVNRCSFDSKNNEQMISSL